MAADYVTVPVMINFNFTPNLREGFASRGISAGYLYSSRQKTISGLYGKHKTFDDFDLNPWRFPGLQKRSWALLFFTVHGDKKYVQ